MRGGVLAGLLSLTGLVFVTTAVQAANKVRYFQLDAVGNVLVVTDENGVVLEQHDYFPFGEECTTGPCAGNTAVGAGEPKKFTSKERDNETGLDYFGARYYASKIGRFTTVDPVMNIKASLLNPQRWNRYAYVSNNPLRLVDPDGREQVVIVNGQTYGGGVDGMSGGNTSSKNTAFLGLVGGTLLAGGAALAPALMTEAAIAGANPQIQAAVQETMEGMAGGAPGARGATQAGLEAGTGFAPGKLLSHFEKHGAEFGSKTAGEYLQGAQNLTRGGEGVQTFVHSNGDRLFYDAAKNQFAATTESGVIKTYFKPVEGAAYWAGQTAK